MTSDVVTFNQVKTSIQKENPGHLSDPWIGFSPVKRI
jgi:hypothetical protein